MTAYSAIFVDGPVAGSVLAMPGRKGEIIFAEEVSHLSPHLFKAVYDIGSPEVSAQDVRFDKVAYYPLAAKFPFNLVPYTTETLPHRYPEVYDRAIRLAELHIRAQTEEREQEHIAARKEFSDRVKSLESRLAALVQNHGLNDYVPDDKHHAFEEDGDPWLDNDADDAYL